MPYCKCKACDFCAADVPPPPPPLPPATLASAAARVRKPAEGDAPRAAALPSPAFPAAAKLACGRGKGKGDAKGKPARPQPPVPRRGGGGASGCDAVLLELPTLLEPECDTYMVEVLSEPLHAAAATDAAPTTVSSAAATAAAATAAAGWRVAVQSAAPPSVSVHGLAADAGHRFRVRIVASGRGAPSEPSEPSVAVLTDEAHSRLAEPPFVSATSSASYALSWVGQASPCQRALLFELQLRRGSGGAWRPLRTGLSKSALSLDELRCPEGCSFRYGPSNLPGGPSELSAPSLPVATLALPRLPRGALRLQVRLLPRTYTASEPASVLERFTAEAAAAVGARHAQVAGVEAREAGRLLVIDLLPPAEHAHGAGGAAGAGGAGGAGGSAAAEELLRRLTASVVAAAAASERPGLKGVTEIARAGGEGEGDAPSVVLGAADIAARRRANAAYGGLLGLAAGSAVLALLYATHARRKHCLRRMRRYAPSSSLFAEGDEGEDEDEGEGEDGDADVPRRGGSVTARLQLRRGDVAADGRAAFELVSPLETLASVQALHAELCRRAAERTGRGVDGVSVAFIDNAGDKVAVDEFTSILDVKREAVSLIVTPTFSLSAESE